MTAQAAISTIGRRSQVSAGFCSYIPLNTEAVTLWCTRFFDRPSAVARVGSIVRGRESGSRRPGRSHGHE
jgi:hypothetical protein